MSSSDTPAPPRAHGPIFVVACPRSGTTMLRNILDAHPNISCGPETGFLQELDRWEAQHPERLKRFGVTPDEYHAHVRDLFSWMHERRAEATGKPRWADKTPSHAIRLDFIDALYPDCQVVHIIRDPVDVVDSWRRKHNLRHAARCAPLWGSHVRRAREFGLVTPRTATSRSGTRTWCASRRRTSAALFEWLGEPWDPAVLDFRSHPSQNPTRGDRQPGVFTSSVGIGRRPLTRLVAARVRWSAGALMKELDYR